MIWKIKGGDYIANNNNLIKLSDRPLDERKHIATLGGLASGKVRQRKKASTYTYRDYFLQDELKTMLKGYHFRNGNITQEQIQEVRKIFKSIYHNKLNYYKYINVSDEEIQALKESYKSVRRYTKEYLLEYIQDKQEIIKDDQAKKKLNNKYRKILRGKKNETTL